MKPEQTERTAAGHAGLRRALGLPLLTLYGLGTIVGAGIYVLIGEVARVAGLFAPLAFVLAACVAAVTALAYAELAARFPRSAGEALYVEAGIGWRGLSLSVGAALVVGGVVSSATLANGVVGYLRSIVDVPALPAVAAVVIALGAIAAWGIRESVFLATLTTLIELAGLLVVLAVASPALATLPERAAALVPPLESGAWLGIASGAFLAFYAFIGFEDMVNIAEEVHEPERNMPRAILLALGIATMLYLLVALVAVLAVPPALLAGSEAPLALVYRQATGSDPLAIGVIGFAAGLNGALIQMIMGARVLYGMSNEGWLPGVFGRAHARTRTPLAATALVTALVLVFALALPLASLAWLTSLTLLSVFALVHLSLARIKRRRDAPRPRWSVPTWVPYAGLAATLGLLALEIAARLR